MNQQFGCAQDAIKPFFEGQVKLILCRFQLGLLSGEHHKLSYYLFNGVGKRGEEISLSKCTARREVSGNEEILLFVTGYMYSSILKKQSGDKSIHITIKKEENWLRAFDILLILEYQQTLEELIKLNQVHVKEINNI